MNDGRAILAPFFRDGFAEIFDGFADGVAAPFLRVAYFADMGVDEILVLLDASKVFFMFFLAVIRLPGLRQGGDTEKQDRNRGRRHPTWRVRGHTFAPFCVFAKKKPDAAEGPSSGRV